MQPVLKGNSMKGKAILSLEEFNLMKHLSRLCQKRNKNTPVVITL